MKKLEKFLGMFGASLASLALIIGTTSVNSACVLYFNQPKVPEAMEKFKK